MWELQHILALETTLATIIDFPLAVNNRQDLSSVGAAVGVFLLAFDSAEDKVRGLGIVDLDAVFDSVDAA
ncbi:MAG: hypothetical protein ACI9VR_004426, partial [Cognaticolwellia sp.]